MGLKKYILLILLLAGCSRTIPTAIVGDHEIFYDHGNLALRDNRTGLKWMTDCPNEHKGQPYDKAHGTVWTFGLGLGLFAENAAAQDDVDKVVVIEISQDVIDLVWPYLNMRGKGEIVRADMWEWIKTAEGPVDFIYADIWMGHEPDYTEQVAEIKRLCQRFECEIVCWNDK